MTDKDLKKRVEELEQRLDEVQHRKDGKKRKEFISTTRTPPKEDGDGFDWDNTEYWCKECDGYVKDCEHIV